MRAGLSLIVLAILLFGGEMAVKWHRGRFAYQRAYAAQADNFRQNAGRYRLTVDYLEAHAAPTHLCSICRKLDRPVSSRLKKVLEKWLESERNNQWCLRLAASPFIATYNRTNK